MNGAVLPHYKEMLHTDYCLFRAEIEDCYV